MACAYLDHFTTDLERGEYSPLTIKNYRCDVAAFSAWFVDTQGDELDPGQVTATVLRSYKQFLIEHRRLKPSSVNRKIAALKSFLAWGIKAGLVLADYMPAVPKALPRERQGPRWLGRREQRALLRAVACGDIHRDLAIVQVLLHTGLRVRELCVLTWQDVTMTKHTRTVTVTNGKGHKRRQIPLNKTVRQALLSIGYREHAHSNTPIFQGKRGPLTVSGVQSMLKKYAQAAQLGSISPHNFRHTFCKNLIDAGVGIEKVAALAGHENLETTRRYCTPSLKDLEQAVELIAT